MNPARGPGTVSTCATGGATSMSTLTPAETNAGAVIAPADISSAMSSSRCLAIFAVLLLAHDTGTAARHQTGDLERAVVVARHRALWYRRGTGRAMDALTAISAAAPYPRLRTADAFRTIHPE